MQEQVGDAATRAPTRDPAGAPRGFSLSALFLGMTLLSVLFAMCAPSLMAPYLLAVGALIGGAMGGVLGVALGLAHHRQGFGLLVAAPTGLVTGVLAGLVAATPPAVSQGTLLAAGLGAVILIALAAALGARS